MSADDYYTLLGVSADADTETIKTAYREQMKIWHPDKNGHRKAQAEEMAKLLNEAYQVLNAPHSRKQYDRMRRYTSGKDYSQYVNDKAFKRKMKNLSPTLKNMIDRIQDLYAMFKDAVNGVFWAVWASSGCISTIENLQLS